MLIPQIKKKKPYGMLDIEGETKPLVTKKKKNL